MNTNTSAVTSLSHNEMRSVNGGGDLWPTFWDGVLQDLIDFKQGFLDGMHGR